MVIAAAEPLSAVAPWRCTGFESEVPKLRQTRMREDNLFAKTGGGTEDWPADEMGLNDEGR
jgi:hypothetical protein